MPFAFDFASFRSPRPRFRRGRLARLCGCSLAVVGLTTGAFDRAAIAQGVQAGQLDVEAWASERLGATLPSVVGEITGSPRILPQQLVLALGLAEIATEVSPDSIVAWRRLFDVATVLRAEMPEAEAAARRAAEALVGLDPEDAVMRFRVLLDRIEQRPTAEARIESFESLLTPENVKRLGDLAAARLAFDLGVLEMRFGDVDQAARRVVDAVNLDPAFPQAADMLAGLLRSASTTPVEEAELLAIAFTASPLDGVFARRLGQLALSEGAYATADGVLDLALILTAGDAPFLEDLVADRALALWGDGRDDEALELLGKAHRVRQVQIRRQMAKGGMAVEMAREAEVPPAPALALVEAAIIGRGRGESDRADAVERLFAAFRFETSRYGRLATTVTDDPELDDESREARLEQIRRRILELTVDQAWARAWFGWTPPIVEGEPAPASLSDLVDRAIAGGVLQEAQKLVIDGWWAIHQDDFATARALLAPASAGSPYAAAGLALVDELEGEAKDAARTYLETYRDTPGELVGLWCRSRLQSLLGVPVPAPDRAEAMTRIVADTLPDAVGRALRDPRHGVFSVQVEPVDLRMTAFDAVPVDITITNVSGLDLAIGADGPVLPTVALIADTHDLPIDGSLLTPIATAVRPAPVVLPLDRRFRIDSQDSIRLRVDLSSTSLGRVIALQSCFSGTLRLRAVVNYSAAPQGAIDAGLFGREGRSPVFRIDGMLPGDEVRAASMLDGIRDPRTVDAVRSIAAILGITAAGPATFPGSAADAQLAAIDAFQKLPPRAQAWVMSVMPGSAAPTRLVDRLVTDDEIGLPLALVRFSPTPTSAAIVRGLESSDPRIRRMAEAARELALRLEAATTQEFGLPQGGGTEGP
jgi:tetratricopeptide (TPR) repeat protein